LSSEQTAALRRGTIPILNFLYHSFYIAIYLDHSDTLLLTAGQLILHHFHLQHLQQLPDYLYILNMALLSAEHLAGPGYIILNIVRGLNIIALASVVASSIVMLVKTFIISKVCPLASLDTDKAHNE
jgi:hypothetical protein